MTCGFSLSLSLLSIFFFNCYESFVLKEVCPIWKRYKKRSLGKKEHGVHNSVLAEGNFGLNVFWTFGQKFIILFRLSCFFCFCFLLSSFWICAPWFWLQLSYHHQRSYLFFKTALLHTGLWTWFKMWKQKIRNCLQICVVHLLSYGFLRLRAGSLNHLRVPPLFLVLLPFSTLWVLFISFQVGCAAVLVSLLIFDLII